MAQKRIFAVVWTPAHNRQTKTKRRATEVMRVWRSWYQRQGWVVNSLGPDAYAATAPDGETRHAIVLHEYDAETKQRLYKEFKAKAAQPPPPPPLEIRKPIKRATPAWA